MTNLTPLSASWRRGASQIKEVEMASALTSLKSLIGAIVPDKNVVVKYTSHDTSYFDPSTFNVRISSKPIDEVPIPSNIFDVLCDIRYMSPPIYSTSPKP